MDKTDEFIISSEIDASKIDTGELDNISKLFFYSSKLQEAKDQIDFKDVDFEIWERFADKEDYKFLLGIHTPVGIFINKYCSWIVKERYRILDLNFFLTSIEELLKDNEMSLDEANELKKYLQRINFGSMLINW